MKANRFISLLVLLFVLLGCSNFNKKEALSLQPVLILSPDKLPSTLASQKAFFYLPQKGGIFIFSLDQNFQMQVNKLKNDFQLSPNGHYLLYTDSLESLEVQVHMLDLLTNEDQVLFESKDIPGGVINLGINDPSLSPDGNRVLFQYNTYSEKFGNSYSEEFGLGVYSLEDRSIQTITKVGFNSRPKYSVAGDKILSICEGKEAIGFQICLMDSDGNNRQRLTDVAGEHDAWFSPDGEHIVYQHTQVSFFRKPAIGLYVMDIEGRNIVKLVDGETHFLTFSTDGKDVVFYKYLENSEDFEGFYVIGLDGKNLRKLAYFDAEFLSKWK